MKYTAGIDLGGTRFKIGIMKNQHLLCSANYPSFRGKDTSHNMDLVKQHLVEMCMKHNVPLNKLNKIGIAFPGIVNPVAGKVVSSRGKYVDAHEFDFRDWAKKHFNASVHIDNDSRMACWGEKTHGAAIKYSDVIMVTFGTGIGTGVIQNGELLIGSHHQGGCLGGHISVMANGHPCFCGNKGCLEIETSIAVLSEYAKNQSDYKNSRLSDNPSFTFAQLFQYTREGDAVAQEVTNYCMGLWGTGLVSFIHAYDPQVLILGGGVLQSGDIIIPFLNKFVKKFAWTPSAMVDIMLAGLGDDAGLIGAANMAQAS